MKIEHMKDKSKLIKMKAKYEGLIEGYKAYSFFSLGISLFGTFAAQAFSIAGDSIPLKMRIIERTATLLICLVLVGLFIAWMISYNNRKRLRVEIQLNRVISAEKKREERLREKYLDKKNNSIHR
ncbi:hypothetical protein ACFPPD_24990 [Cohnella suwonensis]|uniref:Uncharacterized protein n=1 Tax=Cohnella suwonensis TaxID=696072 RepID=A0ABW0M2B1_9BACL